MKEPSKNFNRTAGHFTAFAKQLLSEFLFFFQDLRGLRSVNGQEPQHSPPLGQSRLGSL